MMNSKQMDAQDKLIRDGSTNRKRSESNFKEAKEKIREGGRKSSWEILDKIMQDMKESRRHEYDQ